MPLGPKSRLLLDLLCTIGIETLDFATHPTKGLLNGGGWSDDHQLKRDLARLQQKGLIEKQIAEDRSRWVIKLTSLGQSLLTDDIDPLQSWNQDWDGKWRMIVFDLPERARAQRRELALWLRKRRFGGLQGSTWIRPTFPNAWNDEIGKLKIKASDISFIEGKSFGLSSDRDFVEEAWNFQAINAHYRACINFLSQSPQALGHDWMKTENLLWKKAYNSDPFLPNALLPSGYLGKQAHKLRQTRYQTSPNAS